MDLSYIANNEPNLLGKLEELGCDMDTLLTICKDIFSICDDLSYSSDQTAEFIFRLKNAYKMKQGTPVEDMQLYENSRHFPNRLMLEDRIRSVNYFFKLAPGQGQIEKSQALYKCETCNQETPVKRSDVKNHVRLSHCN